MKNNIIILPLCISFIANFQNAFAANPPNETCVPKMADVEWVKDPNIVRFNLDPMGEKISKILKFIPGGVKPYLSGNFEVASYKKIGCCEPTATQHTTLTKSEISGTAGIGVDTGRLPIPGVSLPAGAGGLYIGASTDISVTLAGSVADTCTSGKGDLCASATLSHNISLYGGLNVAGDAFDIRFTGSGSISGTLEWCQSSGLDVGDICGSASAKITFSFFDNDFYEYDVGTVSTCEDK